MTSPSDTKVKRTVGRPKKVVITASEAAVAQKLDVPLVEVAKQKIKAKRKASAAKQSISMKERWNRIGKLTNDNLQLMDDNSVLLRQVTNLEHQIIGYRAVISYLENQLGLRSSQ